MFELPYRIPNIDKSTKYLLDPHVVIIGAGASKAACPIDKNGLEVPLLRNIHRVLGIDSILDEYGISKNSIEDFESFYSDIYVKVELDDLVKILNDEVYNYFSKLNIPDEPTIYDYLILSLTSKDIIISFNWDPFLLQAYLRNIEVGNLPQVSFLHGNVGVGVCYECKQLGYYKYACPHCKNRFKKMPLLYPIKQKNYSDMEIIKSQWDMARDYMRKAAGLTIFGYGAPVTDGEAILLLKEAYKGNNITEIAPVTIINLANQKEYQLNAWKEFYSERMIVYCESFKDSILWKNPRVSLETIFDAILQQCPRKNIGEYKEFDSLEELQEFIKLVNSFEMAL